MIESPVLKELLDEIAAKKLAEGEARAFAKSIQSILKARFVQVPAEIVAQVGRIAEASDLERLMDWASVCPDLESFRQQLK
jgi:hypothetical protein